MIDLLAVDLSAAVGPFINQASGIIVAFVTIGIAGGTYIAGRGSFGKANIANLETAAKGWQNLYEQAQEQIKRNEEQISDLIAAGHKKDIEIASLTGKIDVILDFMQRALGPGFKQIIETTTTKTTTGV